MKLFNIPTLIQFTKRVDLHGQPYAQEKRSKSRRFKKNFDEFYYAYLNEQSNIITGWKVGMGDSRLTEAEWDRFASGNKWQGCHKRVQIGLN